jgi:hypothetical protein
MSARPANLERIEARQTPAGNRQLNAPPRARLQARLFEPGLARCILSSYALLWAGTILFALIAVPFAGPLHEVFGLSGGLAAPGTTSMAALTLTNNAREAAIPFLFALLRVGARRWPIVLGNVVIAACFTADVALGGLALGTDGMRALPYLPQWPLEWAGLALALAAWRRARSGRRDPLELTLLAIGTAVLLCVAALLETYAVPQS